VIANAFHNFYRRLQVRQTQFSAADARASAQVFEARGSQPVDQASQFTTQNPSRQVTDDPRRVIFRPTAEQTPKPRSVAPTTQTEVSAAESMETPNCTIVRLRQLWRANGGCRGCLHLKLRRTILSQPFRRSVTPMSSPRSPDG
jgi:hypothetical protein